jgi:hypothetical protein
MAGDWIKMRTDLYRDPKVCVMADHLMRHLGWSAQAATQQTAADVAQHVAQQSATAAQQSATRKVTRCACVGALLSVWGVLRHRGKRFGDDLCCAGVALSVIDDIADIPGFGDSMASVGWAKQTASGLTLPRFFSEYNAEPADTTKSKAAERMAKCRRNRVAQQSATDAQQEAQHVAQQEAQHVAQQSATGCATVAPRIEKNREEKRDTAGAVLGGVPKAQTPTPAKPAARFVAPTVSQVAEYVTAIGSKVDPERFVNFYAAKGWMIGRNSMKDWKAAVRTWEKNEHERTGNLGSGAAGVHASTGRAPQRSREQQREDANKAALAEFLLDGGVRTSNLGFDHSQANVGLHDAADKGMVLRLEAVPSSNPERSRRGVGNG